MNPPPAEHPSFEQALTELEKIVRELEDGQVTLEESLARYERGIALLKLCYNQLQQAEQKIQLLTGVDDEDRPVARPFQHAPADVEKAETTRKRKPVEKIEKPEELF
jgi:exodeoxyribonuclease VII small subunit